MTKARITDKTMNIKKIYMYTICILILVFLISLWVPELRYLGRSSRLTDNIVETPDFRSQPVGENLMKTVRKMEQPGEYLALFWLENNFDPDGEILTADMTENARKRWETADGWSNYLASCLAIWDDAVYFPIAFSAADPGFSISYENSWMFERTYGGERRHEGTDLIPSSNESGRIPVISMTDGIVINNGWLELGGYRLGITAPGGAYFYYAHLDSPSPLSVGDRVQAGDFIGFMGDTGYGPEGTRKKFPVHLHLGIYLISGDREISVNPYPLLRYTEQNRISAVF